MSPPERLARAGSKLDEWIHPSIQRAIITAIMLGVLGKMGLSMTAVNALLGQAAGIAESNAVTLSNLEATVTTVLDRQYAERRKTFTLTNDIAEIKAALKRLEDKP